MKPKSSVKSTHYEWRVEYAINSEQVRHLCLTHSLRRLEREPRTSPSPHSRSLILMLVSLVSLSLSLSHTTFFFYFFFFFFPHSPLAGTDNESSICRDFAWVAAKVLQYAGNQVRLAIDSGKYVRFLVFFFCGLLNLMLLACFNGHDSHE